ncbi:hypothetical protein H6G33_25525 [Calothrix sp. FACHB-1219]|uniref:hypothetical protein n=1 Tax=unclassified Calothrix TaxID=2619626 RepID=UPI001689CA16|nr:MULTISPECIES: hypothetical protein [unclassified Calothrix]MBD2207867.1 hypothetical protein [Calothrix sp. FACHB-168]MBD2220369.1 hypothetical protein [Calothrix sp. FACHB-1219]
MQQQLQRTDVVSQPDNKKQVQKLNNLESQAWLYEGILERLGADPYTNHEKIARTLEALEYKRSEILQELEPRRPKSYRVLAGLQDSVRNLLASQAEIDYEQLQKIVTNLVLFIRSRQPSQIIISEAINKLATEIAQSKDKISPYRLRLAYRIDELMRILSAKLIINSNTSTTDSDYQLLVNELRSRISLLSQEFKNLLQSRYEDQNELKKRVQEVANLTKNISDLHRDISNRDADIAVLRNNIQNLTESIQDKQTQVDRLQQSIRNLQKEIQDSSEFNQRSQDQISQLQKQLSHLNQQKISLQKRIEDLTAYACNKESEVEGLLKEKTQLNSQKLELQRQNQALSQNYQHQQDVIAGLNQQLEDLTRANQAKSDKRFATQERISEAEYQTIANQDEYEYVSGYTNSRSGKWVEPYYRSKRRR